MQITAADTTRWLNNIALHHTQQGMFVADRVCPRVAVSRMQGKLAEIVSQRDSIQNVEDLQATIGAHSDVNVIETTRSQQAFVVNDNALLTIVPRRDVDEADDPYSPLQDAAEFLLEKFDLLKERQMGDLISDDTSYGTNQKKTVTGVAMWDSTAAKVVDNILEAIEGCSPRATVLCFGSKAWRYARQNTGLIQSLNIDADNTFKGMAPRRRVGDLFECDVLISDVKLTKSNAGQTATEINAFDDGTVVALHLPDSARSGNRLNTFRGTTFAVNLERESPTVTIATDFYKGSKDGAYLVKVSYPFSITEVDGKAGFCLYDVVS